MWEEELSFGGISPISMNLKIERKLAVGFDRRQRKLRVPEHPAERLHLSRTAGSFPVMDFLNARHRLAL